MQFFGFVFNKITRRKYVVDEITLYDVLSQSDTFVINWIKYKYYANDIKAIRNKIGKTLNALYFLFIH